MNKAAVSILAELKQRAADLARSAELIKSLTGQISPEDIWTVTRANEAYQKSRNATNFYKTIDALMDKYRGDAMPPINKTLL